MSEYDFTESGIYDFSWESVEESVAQNEIAHLNGMILNVGKYEFEVLFTPGHAPGHCCFYCREAGWLFSGDLVFWHSYGRTDLTGGNEETLMQSIRERILTLPEDTLILPGHENYTTVKDEKIFY